MRFDVNPYYKGLTLEAATIEYLLYKLTGAAEDRDFVIANTNEPAEHILIDEVQRWGLCYTTGLNETTWVQGIVGIFPEPYESLNNDGIGTLHIRDLDMEEFNDIFVDIFHDPDSEIIVGDLGVLRLNKNAPIDRYRYLMSKPTADNKKRRALRKTNVVNKLSKSMQRLAPAPGTMQWAQAYGRMIARTELGPFDGVQNCLSASYIDPEGLAKQFTKDQLYFIAKGQGKSVTRRMNKRELCYAINGLNPRTSAQAPF